MLEAVNSFASGKREQKANQKNSSSLGSRISVENDAKS